MPNNHLYRIIGFTILVLACLAVPYTHGYLQYFGLIFTGLLLIVISFAFFGNRRTNDPLKAGKTDGRNSEKLGNSGTDGTFPK